MNEKKKKPVKPARNEDDGEGERVKLIGSVTVSCAPGPVAGTRNVTVTALGIAAPLGPPATCGLAGLPKATLILGGSPMGDKFMDAVISIAGKYVATFFGMPTGSYTARVDVNWNIMKPESATSASVTC